MIRSAILSFYRSLLRHPLYAGLNLLGLAAGIAAFILLSLFVRFETRYDHWLPDADHIYAIAYTTKTRQAAHLPPRYTSAEYALEAVHRVFPHVTGTRIDADYMTVRVGRRLFAEDGQNVDRDFFKVFDVPVVAGDREAALAAPDGLILSQRTAQKYFGSTGVIGQVVYIRDDGAPINPSDGTPPAEKAWRVLAVLRDAPANASLRFDILRLRRVSRPDWYWFTWGGETRTYFRTDRATHDRLARGLTAAIRAYPAETDLMKTYFTRVFGTTGLQLLPLGSEHLADTRARRAVAAVDAAGVLTLAVALINYVNLATARAGLRAREVAIRKAAGAGRTGLVLQFLVEALLLGFAALMMAFSLVELCLPLINTLGRLSLRLDYVRDGSTLLALAGAVLAGSAIAGLYPALALSAFQPARGLSLAKAPAGGRSGRLLREGLAVVQFTAASAFFIVIIGLAAQVRHMETERLGIARDRLLTSDAPVSRLVSPQRAAEIHAAWRRTPGITAVASGPVPGRYFLAPRWQFHLAGSPKPVEMQMAWTEGDFFAAYRTDLLAGRVLSLDDDLRRQHVDPVSDDMPNAAVAANAMLNLTAVRVLGLQSPAAALGRTVMLGRSAFRIVGVAADQRFQAPTQKILPAIYVYSSLCVVQADTIIGYAGIDEATARQRVEATWRALAPDLPFNLSSGREILDYYYADDRRNARLFAVGGGIAGLIGAVGLFGMAAFNTSARVQEIAVRKSFGASRFRIARLLLLQLLRPVLIANVLAWPAAFIVLDGWLKPFDDRIAISPLFFSLGSGLSLLIAAATVAGVALSAARTAPGSALRQG